MSFLQRKLKKRICIIYSSTSTVTTWNTVLFLILCHVVATVGGSPASRSMDNTTQQPQTATTPETTLSHTFAEIAPDKISYLTSPENASNTINSPTHVSRENVTNLTKSQTSTENAPERANLSMLTNTKVETRNYTASSSKTPKIPSTKKPTTDLPGQIHSSLVTARAHETINSSSLTTHNPETNNSLITLTTKTKAAETPNSEASTVHGIKTTSVLPPVTKTPETTQFSTSTTNTPSKLNLVIPTITTTTTTPTTTISTPTASSTTTYSVTSTPTSDSVTVDNTQITTNNASSDSTSFAVTTQSTESYSKTVQHTQTSPIANLTTANTTIQTTSKPTNSLTTTASTTESFPANTTVLSGSDSTNSVRSTNNVQSTNSVQSTNTPSTIQTTRAAVLTNNTPPATAHTDSTTNIQTTTIPATTTLSPTTHPENDSNPTTRTSDTTSTTAPTTRRKSTALPSGPWDTTRSEDLSSSSPSREHPTTPATKPDNHVGHDTSTTHPTSPGHTGTGEDRQHKQEHSSGTSWSKSNTPSRYFRPCNRGGLNPSHIVGIVIGSIVVLIICAGLFIRLVGRYKPALFYSMQGFENLRNEVPLDKDELTMMSLMS